MFTFIIIICVLTFFYIFSLLKLKRKHEKEPAKRKPIHANDLAPPEINTEREKKEVKKEAIEDWKRDNKNTRKHFEKERKDRKDKDKRRDTPNSDPNNAGPKMGKPKGGNGGAWKRPPENEVDNMIHVYLNKCPKCGKDNLGKPFSSWEHHVLDLVPIKRGMQLRLTNYIMHRYRCKNCKKIVSTNLGILKNCHFGFGFIAMVMQSRISRKQSYSKILEELTQWVPDWNQFISKTTIVDWFKKYGSCLEEFYLECVKKLKEAKYVHADETGLPMRGKNWWLWVKMVCLSIDKPSRNHP